MANLSGFDANQVEPAKSREALPAGKYVAVITESEMKATKAGTGEYLNVTFEVIEGEHKGRKTWARLNLNNPNNQAVQIAQAELSAICRAVGVLTPNDSTELHDLPLVIDVACRKRPDNGEINNEIKGYHKKDAPAATAPATAKTPPWKKS